MTFLNSLSRKHRMGVLIGKANVKYHEAKASVVFLLGFLIKNK